MLSLQIHSSGWLVRYDVTGQVSCSSSGAWRTQTQCKADSHRLWRLYAWSLVCGPHGSSTNLGGKRTTLRHPLDKCFEICYNKAPAADEKTSVWEGEDMADEKIILLTIPEYAFLSGRTLDSVRWSIRVGKLEAVKIHHDLLIPSTQLPMVGN